MTVRAVRASDLRFAYPGGPEVIRGVSFALDVGERLGVVGANGAGKSTLLKLLAGAMAPGGGELAILDQSATPRTLDRVRSSAGLIFQDPDDMLFMPTARADVAFGPASRGLDARTVARRVEAALSATGSLGLAGRAPWTLSGGEKRSVSLSAVLALEPPLLLLDEPSAGLDPAARRSLIATLIGLGGTHVVAAHDLDLVLDLCPRVLILSQGTIVADGPATEVLADRALLERNHLELPLRLQGCPRCGDA